MVRSLDIEPVAELVLPAEGEKLVMDGGRLLVAVGTALCEVELKTLSLRPLLPFEVTIGEMVARPGGGLILGLSNGDLVDVRDDRVAHRWATGRGDFRSLVVSPDGTRAAASHSDVVHGAPNSVEGLVDLWELESRTRVESFQTHRGQAFALAWSPDGRRLAVGANTAHVNVFDLADPRHPANVLRGRSRCIYAVSWLDDERLLSIPFGRTVDVWDVGRGIKLGTLRGKAGDAAASNMSILETAVARRGDCVAVAGGDLVIRLYSLATFSAMAIGRGHTGFIRHLTFVDDTTLVSVARDRTLRLWRLP